MMEFTGERFVPEVHGNIELEHLHRYLFASKAVAGKTVLDIACGEGYGSAMLAQTAHKVIGVDISPEAVSHAQTKYQADNLEFHIGSCTSIPLDAGSVDVVVSFETIEHHSEHDAMMREIKRVLRPDGAIVISSPDKLEYSDRPGYSNPYHVKELYRDEFKKLLHSYFRQHHIYGQRVIYGSAIFLEDGLSLIESYERAGSALSATPGLPHAAYLVAVASDDVNKKILRIQGTSVSSVTDAGLSNSLYGVWFVPCEKYHVVGAGIGLKTMLDSSPWNVYPSGMVTSYMSGGVRGNNINDVFVTGSFFEIVHYNGSTWHNYKDVIPFTNGAVGRIAVKGNLMVTVGLSGQNAVAIMGKRE